MIDVEAEEKEKIDEKEKIGKMLKEELKVVYVAIISLSYKHAHRQYPPPPCPSLLSRKYSRASSRKYSLEFSRRYFRTPSRKYCLWGTSGGTETGG